MTLGLSLAAALENALCLFDESIGVEKAEADEARGRAWWWSTVCSRVRRRSPMQAMYDLSAKSHSKIPPLGSRGHRDLLLHQQLVYGVIEHHSNNGERQRTWSCCSAPLISTGASVTSRRC